ncbi:MAG: 1-phosphofructokinase family hexose kinase [Anaerolineales bacterium]|nr:1-phosphofructokinase family hexose kinase [Anaerolineales bacterium]
MILAINPNTAIDRTLFIPAYVPGATIRATNWAVGMGGKAADAAWILGVLGYPCRLLGFAAGEAGQQMEKMLRTRGVEVDFTPVGGETRVNTVLVEEKSGEQSTISVDTLQVQPQHVDALSKAVRAALLGCSCVVLGGSLPRGVKADLYAEWIRAAVELDKPVILDASGEALRAGLTAGPTVIKPNRDELGTLAGKRIRTLEEAYEAGKQILDETGTIVVLTLGVEGALVVQPEQTWRIPPLEVPVVSTAGAGDGVLAGLAAALSQGDPLEKGARLGFAAAAAVMQTPGTADCRLADVERFKPRVSLKPYP